MATARMRHHNSPEELSKRLGEGEPLPRRGKEFRHYNHPDEVAKRESQGQGGVAISRRVINSTGEPPVWPPPGTEDNTAVESPAWPHEEREAALPQGGDVEKRLRRIESLLWTFVDSIAEAREFRRLLNNQAAVTDVQLDINNRVRTLEDTIEAALAEQDEADDDAPPALPPLEDDPSPRVDSSPPPTVPDVPKPGGAP